MKIKNRIIKLLGGYTDEEYDKLIMSYTNLRRRCAMKDCIHHIPKVISEEKRVHTIHSEIHLGILCDEYNNDEYRQDVINEAKQNLFKSLDDYIDIEESDYKIKITLKVVDK